MTVTDEDAVICDFLQYYGITDMKGFGIERQAILACGLPPESRIMRKMSGNRLTTTETLLAALIDSVNAFRYLFTCSKSKHKPQKPDSVLDKLTGKEEAPQCRGFDSAEELERYMASFAQEREKEDG